MQYGRKVFQRLEAVAPARQALQAALSAVPQRSADLEAAIKAARPAASLLDPQLLVDAEVGGHHVIQMGTQMLRGSCTNRMPGAMYCPPDKDDRSQPVAQRELLSVHAG